MRMPKGRSISLTRRSMARAIGPRIATMIVTGRDRNSETLSGEVIASVFGRTSAKTMTRTDIVTVA